jgi:hypothetical protein
MLFKILKSRKSRGYRKYTATTEWGIVMINQVISSPLIYISPKIVPIYLIDGKCKTTRHIKIVRGQHFKIFVAA